MSIATKLIETAFDAGKSIALDYRAAHGSETLARKLLAGDFAFDELRSTFKDHPVEAYGAVAAGAVATILLGPAIEVTVDGLVVGAVARAVVGGIISSAVDTGVETGLEQTFEYLNEEAKRLAPSQSPLTFEHITGDVDTYEADLPGGRSVSVTFPKGSSDPSSRVLDIENRNGTSSITSYGADGSYHTSLYSGANGSGDLIGERGFTPTPTSTPTSPPTSPPPPAVTPTPTPTPAPTGFEGQSVSLDVYVPQVKDADKVYHGVAVVGSQVEFGGGGSTPQPNVRLLNFTSDLSNDTIAQKFPVSEEGTTITSATFNGDVFSILDSKGPKITGASVIDTNVPGFDNSKLSIYGNSLLVNAAGLTLPSNQPAYWDLHVDFAHS